ncbi:hypothetical protein [Pseudonocardia nigra]|uniref:hypothetical protein n=1 Tax=Pseudonocardia nigra TaxID=1921578 RepID=UPI001C5E488A|nr:hypothetical protein [Pseudonocardia nigra]
MRERTVPYLETLVGGAWWTIGAAALDGGFGTVVLAAGLGLTGAIVVALRRHGPGGPLTRAARTRLLLVFGITAALMAVSGTVLGFFDLGELTVPLACVMTGVALVSVSSVLDERSVLAAGGGLMVLGAVGAVLAFDSAGALYPQGVVGLVAGLLLWTVGAHRTGLLRELRGRARR